MIPAVRGGRDQDRPSHSARRNWRGRPGRGIGGPGRVIATGPLPGKARLSEPRAKQREAPQERAATARLRRPCFRRLAPAQDTLREWNRGPSGRSRPKSPWPSQYGTAAISIAAITVAEADSPAGLAFAPRVFPILLCQHRPESPFVLGRVIPPLGIHLAGPGSPVPFPGIFLRQTRWSRRPVR